MGLQNEINNSKKYNEFYDDSKSSSDILNLSTISNYPFLNNFHFICKKCNTIPNIFFTKINKVIFACKCNKSGIEIPIKDFGKYLYFSEEENDIPDILICKEHNAKFGYYCYKCGKNYTKNVVNTVVSIQRK